MKSTQIIILIIVAIVIIAAIFYFSPFKRESSGGEFVVEISNNTNTVKLEIPKGALPAGVNEQDVSITPVSELKEEEGVVMYELKPDALEFLKPVTITLTQEASLGEVIPVLFHITDEEFEIIPDTTVEINLDTGKISISGEITHLSRVGTDYVRGIFAYFVTSGGDGFIGDIFPFSVTIRAGQNWHWNYRKDFGYRITPGSNWSVKSFGVRSTTGRLEPIVIESPEQTMALTEKFDFESTHVCEEKGEDNLRNTKAITIAYNIEKQWIIFNDPHTETKNVTTGISFTYEDYTCQERQMVRVCPPTSVICEESGKWTTGYYECDPVTGEPINDILLDLETDEPLEFTCP